ncbi:MAG: methyltransferase domain-containing protein [Clostridiaceae bacterium]|nr:methyltransferase domain-containing protein [Eubacteriales bacterium]
MNRSLQRASALLRCACGGGLRLGDDALNCAVCGRKYAVSGNVVHFIAENGERPFWARQLDDWIREQGIELDMGERYASSPAKCLGGAEQAERFFGFIAGSGDSIVDLASGPSGYFGGLFDKLNDRQLLIATDASAAVIHAHSATNLDTYKNFLMLDIDLDKPLPFRDNSVDAFMGYLVSNVAGYMELVREVCRCLKPDGRFAVAEVFYEKSGPTDLAFRERGISIASYEAYIEYCQGEGLALSESRVLYAMTGKLDPSDEYPLGDDEKSEIRALYFCKAAQ